MLTIEKSYHFYAAHRNEMLDDKCKNLHGHKYDVTCKFSFTEIGEDGVTMLFSDIDRRLEPLFKSELDHSTLMSFADPVKEALLSHGQKVIELPHGTSVELLCGYLFDRVIDLIPSLISISIKETQSSLVTMSKEYYQKYYIPKFYGKR